MKKIIQGVVVVVATLAGVWQVNGELAFSALPNMSDLNKYAIFGGNYDLSNCDINNGPAGIWNGVPGTGVSGADLTVMAPSYIHGNVYLGTGATGTGAGWQSQVGTVYTGQNLTAAQNQFSQAWQTFLGMHADFTALPTAVNNVYTFTKTDGIADVVVITLSSLMIGGNSVAFVGDPGDVFVLNVTGDVHLQGNIGSSTLASRTLLNFTANSFSSTIANITATINGTVLIPNGDGTLHSVSGAVYSGANQITLASGAQIDYTQFVPEPATFAAAMLLLLPFGASTIRILRRKER